MSLDDLNSIEVSSRYSFKLRLRRFLAGQAARIVRMGTDELALRKQTTALKTAESAKALAPVSDYYSEEVEVGVWWKYQRAISDPNGAPNIRFHSKLLIEEVDRILQSGSFTSVVNFGVAFGHADHELAKKHPEVVFSGVDRSPVAKTLNENAFGTDNLSFHARDILEFLEDGVKAGPTTVFVHQRTCAFLYPELIRRVYEKCYELGIPQILCIEPIGFCYSTNSFYEFSLQERPSRVLRHPLIVHNYPGLLAEAGYDLLQSDALEYPHVFDDMRALRIVANRR